MPNTQFKDQVVEIMERIKVSHADVAVIRRLDDQTADIQVNDSATTIKNVSIRGDSSGLSIGQTVSIIWEERPGSYGQVPVVIASGGISAVSAVQIATVIPDGVTIYNSQHGLAIVPGGIKFTHLSFVPALSDHTHPSELAQIGWETTETGTLLGQFTSISRSGNISLGESPDMLFLDGMHPKYRIWIGTDDPASAPFSVEKDGTIKSTDGLIGGCVIAPAYIASTNFVTSSAGWKIESSGQAEFQDVIVRGEIQAAVFAEQHISPIGGWLMIAKDQDFLPAGVLSTDTQINFGKTMIVNDIVEMRKSGQVEFFKVGTLVSGTTYNVTRNLDGSGANDWDENDIFVVLGQRTYTIPAADTGTTASALTIGSGTLPGIVNAADTTINFGTSQTVGNYSQIGSVAITAEWVLIGTLVSGTTYNVTRGRWGTSAIFHAASTPWKSTQGSLNVGQALPYGTTIIFDGGGNYEEIDIGTLISGTTYNVERDRDYTFANSWASSSSFTILWRVTNLIDITDTTIDFGRSLTPNDYYIIRERNEGIIEIVQIGTLVSGTEYNVTRDLNGNGPKTWFGDAIYYEVTGGDQGWIELNAYDSPRMTFHRSGTTYNDSEEVIRIGSLDNVWNYNWDAQGFIVGVDENESTGISIDSINGFRIINRDSTGAYKTLGQWDVAGNLTLGVVDTNKPNVFIDYSGGSVSFRYGLYGLNPGVVISGGSIWVDQWADTDPLPPAFPSNGIIYLDSSYIRLHTTDTADNEFEMYHDGPYYSASEYSGGQGSDQGFEFSLGGYAVVKIGHDSGDYHPYLKGGSVRIPLDGGGIELLDSTAPGTPSSGFGVIYVNSDKLYYKDDGGAPTLLSFLGCGVSQGTITNHFSNATWTSITFSGESFDIGGCHSTVSNTERFVAPVAGYYQLNISISFPTSDIGDRLAIIYNNSAAILAYVGLKAAQYNRTTIHLSAIGYLAASGYFYCQGLQNIGSAMDLYASWAQFTRIG